MPARGSLAQLRIKPEDLLMPEDLETGDLKGEWVRVRHSDKAHRVSPDHTIGYCGMPLVMPEYWYEGWRGRVKDYSGKDPGDIFMARDRRKDARCPGCKEGFPDSKYITESPHSPEDAPGGDFAPFGPAESTIPDQIMRSRFNSKVAWVARELGATIVSADTQT